MGREARWLLLRDPCACAFPARCVPPARGRWRRPEMSGPETCRI